MDENIHHCFLESGAEISAVGLGRLGQQVTHRSLQAAEAELEVAGAFHAAWKIEARGISCPGSGLDLRATRVAEVEQFRHLVECLACSIVEGASEKAVARVAVDVDEQRVPAADNQSDGAGDVRAPEKR